MQIFIKTLAGKTLALDVEPSDMIEHVQMLIQDHEGIPVEAQCLVFAGLNISVHNRVCECGGAGAGRNLEDFDIQAEATLHLVGRLRGGLPQCVFVNTPPGKTMAVSLEEITLDHVKRKINEHWGVPLGKQELMFGSRLLEDSACLLDCGIEPFHYCEHCGHGAPAEPDNHTLEMKPSMLTVSASNEGGQLSVSITNLAGEEVLTFALNADSATVLDLRQLVLKHHGPGFALVTADGGALTVSDELPLKKALPGL